MVKLYTTDADGRIHQEDLPGTRDEPPAPVLKTTTLIGLDLGQRSDYTALAGIERHQLGREPARYQVRRLRRWREIAYTAIVAELVERLAAWGLGREDTLVVDETGVGAGIVDMFKAAPLKTTFSPVTITAGFEASRVGQGYHVPKRDLVAVMAVLLEQRRIEVADGMPESATLRAELGNFRTKVSAAGYDSYSAWREADHDDLVLAVALAVWVGEQPRRVPYVY